MAWLRCRAAPLRDRGGDSPGEPDSLNHDLFRARSLWGVKSLRPPPTATGSWHANTRKAFKAPQDFLAHQCPSGSYLQNSKEQPIQFQGRGRLSANSPQWPTGPLPPSPQGCCVRRNIQTISCLGQHQQGIHGRDRKWDRQLLPGWLCDLEQLNLLL